MRAQYMNFESKAIYSREIGRECEQKKKQYL